jgi:hypothetical protein
MYPLSEMNNGTTATTATRAMNVTPMRFNQFMQLDKWIA